MHTLWLALATLLLVTMNAFGETVSIINTHESLSSNLVEAALKKNLRADGYTVKGGTNEGIVILLTVTEIQNGFGVKSGIAGNVSIVNMSWQKVADLWLSEACKGEKESAQQITAVLGTPMIYIGNYIAVSSDERSLAEMLATASNTSLRSVFRRIQAFMDGVEAAREQSSRIINPIR